jgi:acetyltransferase-like isoleucine patch superfamily enzyme
VEKLAYGVRRMRALWWRMFFGHIGKCTNISQRCVFTQWSNIFIGSHTHVGYGVEINATGGKVEIGDGVAIASQASLMNANHKCSSREIPIINQGTEKGTITIEDQVWIGTKAIILPGVRIGKGAIVGAGSVVTHDVLPFTVVAGVPAKVIKCRE